MVAPYRVAGASPASGLLQAHGDGRRRSPLAGEQAKDADTSDAGHRASRTGRYKALLKQRMIWRYLRVCVGRPELANPQQSTVSRRKQCVHRRGAEGPGGCTLFSAPLRRINCYPRWIGGHSARPIPLSWHHKPLILRLRTLDNTHAARHFQYAFRILAQSRRMASQIQQNR